MTRKAMRFARSALSAKCISTLSRSCWRASPPPRSIERRNPMNRKKAITAGVVVAYLAIAFFLVQFLAGIFYFLANKTLPHDVAIGSWWNYWHFYSDDPIQRKRLQFAIVFALLVVLGVPLLILNALFHKTRSLHGDARFATDGEIRKKGYMGHEGVIIGKRGSHYLTQR